MVYAILIGTSVDGSKKAVTDVLPLKDAKQKINTLDGDGLSMVEVFELRQHSKRRKLGVLRRSAVTPTSPTFEAVAQQLASGAVVIPAEGLTGKGVPTVSAINEAFGLSIDAKARDDIWAKCEEITAANLETTTEETQ